MATVGADGDLGAASDAERQSLEDQYVGKFNAAMQEKLAAIETRLGL